MIAVPSSRTPSIAPRVTPVVAMVGGGQLARMTHQAAIALGQNLRVLASAADDPAAQVTPDVVIGSHTDLDDLRRAAAGADVLTFDHEHVPTELLDKLVAEGVNVAPPPRGSGARPGQAGDAATAGGAGRPGAALHRLDKVDDLAISTPSPSGSTAPLVIKTVRGGYDGRGVRTGARSGARRRAGRRIPG